MGKLVKNETPEILQLHDPGAVMSFGNKLKGYIKANQLSVNIQGREFALVDAWKFAGMNFGVSAIPTKPVMMHEPGKLIRIGFAMVNFRDRNGNWREYEKAGFIALADDKEKFEQWKSGAKFTREIIKPHFAYECEADAVRFTDGVKVGAGDGFCENLELAKAQFDQYAVRSMAQTRAIGKALRNLIGFVMNSAGFEVTPAEEMEEMRREENESQDPSDNRQPIPEAVFKKAVVKLSKKETTLEKIEAAYLLSPEQLETLKAL